MGERAFRHEEGEAVRISSPGVPFSLSCPALSGRSIQVVLFDFREQRFSVDAEDLGRMAPVLVVGLEYGLDVFFFDFIEGAVLACPG